MDGYCWELRRVTREGFAALTVYAMVVSSWQYNGKDVQVRLHNGDIEIYYEEVLAAKHTAQYTSGSILCFLDSTNGWPNGTALPRLILCPGSRIFR